VGYSAEDVAKLLGIPVRTVSAWVRDGFLAPARDAAGEAQFSFQDVVLLRTAQGLIGASIAPARVRKALARLKKQLPAGRPLTGVAIAAEGNRIVVRDGGARWNPESGQVLFDFRVEEAGDGAPSLMLTELKPRAAKEAAAAATADSAAEGSDSADWYQVGCTREDEGDVDGAIAAYRRTLATNDGHAEARINLGRLLHDRGEAGEAVLQYRRVLETRPEDPIALFNLGVALEDQELLAEAADAYERAVKVDPRAADAHYNLAGVYERIGDRAAAIRHLRAYKKLTGK
jgi:tetratricopeptide (TPR) repeat protein